MMGKIRKKIKATPELLTSILLIFPQISGGASDYTCDSGHEYKLAEFLLEWNKDHGRSK